MRTAQEIYDYVTGPGCGFFGFALEAVAGFLPYDVIKPGLKLGTIRDDWSVDELTEAGVLECMREYIERIGWPKIIDHRGISANRTIEKCRAWIYALGHDVENVTGSADSYVPYGAPILAKICRHFNFPIPVDSSLEGMIAGRPCRADCEEGCNHY